MKALLQMKMHFAATGGFIWSSQSSAREKNVIPEHPWGRNLKSSASPQEAEWEQGAMALNPGVRTELQRSHKPVREAAVEELGTWGMKDSSSALQGGNLLG